MTEPESLQQVRRTYVRYQGRTLSYFTGCDYFRLSTHPKIHGAIAQGLKKYGLSVAASRRTTGNHALYSQLETALAKFFRAEAAVVVSTGYATNLVVAQALAGQFSHVLLDDKTHMALKDAAQVFDCPIIKFQHRDTTDFERALTRCGRGARPIVLTDGMFSYDGSIAPLRAYLKLLPRDGLVLVDDAHGGGTLGKNGGGAVELEGVSRTQVVQCVTLSKAFGVFGGAVICSKELRKQIIERSAMFIGSTPLPLPLVNAGLTAVSLLKANKAIRTRMNHNGEFVKRELRKAGLKLPDQPGPIVPFVLESPKANAALRSALLKAGIYPSFIRYGNGPQTGYFRFVISSEHSQAQLDALVKTLKRFIP